MAVWLMFRWLKQYFSPKVCKTWMADTLVVVLCGTMLLIRHDDGNGDDDGGDGDGYGTPVNK